VRQRAAYVEARRIRERQARLHEAVRDLRAPHALEVRQLRLVVHAQDLRRRRREERLDADLVLHGQGDHVGQVVLALRIGAGELGEPPLQQRGRAGQHPGVALARASPRPRASFCSTMRRTRPRASRTCVRSRAGHQLHGEQARARVGEREQRRSVGKPMSGTSP
jgi:hypothetical protein